MTAPAPVRAGPDGPAGRPGFPLTELQEAYLVGMSPLLELGGFRPHFYVELDVVGLAPERLEHALGRLVERHEHLRTVVRPDGTQEVLVAHRLPPLTVPVTDVRALPPDGREAALAAVRARVLATGLDPATWPLFRVEVTRVRPGRARVHVGMSLLLLDAHSTWHLLEEAVRLHEEPALVLPPVAATFREWQEGRRRHRESPAYAEHERYWADRVDTLPAAPVLPLAGPLRDLPPGRFTRRSLVLPPAAWQRLCRTARRHRVLPAAALAHAFAETLGLWATSPHFCLNVLHQSWRGRPDTPADVVGQLGATLPLEVDLRAAGTSWERAARLQSQLWRDLEHGDVTAVRIMRDVATRRGWSARAALPYVFNSMLGVRATGRRPGRPWGVVAESGLRTPHVLIDNQVQDTPDGGVLCVWDVVDDAFPPGLPQTMFTAYGQLLEALAGPAGSAEPPGGAEPAVPVLEAHRATVERLNAPVGVPAPERLEAGFLRQARDRPDAVALVTPQLSMTYAELAAASAAVARRLVAAGTRRGDLVPVVAVKGWEQVVAVLGTLRAGAAYCPIDAGLPAARVADLVAECSAPAGLRQSAAAGATEGPGPVWCDVDRLTADPEPDPVTEPDPGATGDLAYVIHTSGSTGRPKGVMIEHGAAYGTISDIDERVGIGPGDRVFGLSSLSFDLSVWDVFGTLSAGATLVLPAPSAGPAPLEWAATAAAHGVTVWNSVPALAELLLEVVEHRPEAGRPPLRAVLLSGDWIPLTLPPRLHAGWPGVRVLALGGATEASIWSNVHEVDEVDPAWRSVPYGRPLRGQTMRVLDHRLEVRAPWAVGGIHIGGAGLARGYLGDAARTAERFVVHPRTGERLYRTGDLGRAWPDGTIEFLGREDRQLKLQGFRVEPGEVEAAIRDVPGVLEGVVLPDVAPGGGTRLVALVVPRPDAAVTAAAVLDALRRRLPAYLVPARVDVVAGLPLSANGKVDPAAALAQLRSRPAPLPATAGTAATAETATAGTVGPDGVPGRLAARPLARLWHQVLDLPDDPAADPDPTEDFFALGGNSLLALRLVHRIRAELGVDVPFGGLLAARTLGGVAGLVEDARAGHGDRPARREAAAVRLSGGRGPVLVLFHPVGGSVACYAPLADAWPGPVHALQSPALVAAPPDDAPAGTFEDLAAGYAQEVRRLVPDGPLLLGGWSMGGVLAHEVGRGLAGPGRRVHVVLLDSVVPARGPVGTDADLDVAFLADLAGGRLPAAARARVTGAPATARGRVAHEVAVSAGLVPADLDAAAYARLARVHAVNLRLLADHRPGPTSASTLLVVATRSRRPDPAPAWRALCPDLQVERWPTDHHGIVTGAFPRRAAELLARWSA